MALFNTFISEYTKDVSDLCTTFFNSLSLLPSRSIGNRTGTNLFFKAENFQLTGSFKIRGATNKMAMLGKVPYTAVRDTIFTHPTMAESLNLLFAGI